MDHKPILLKQASKKQEKTNWENIVIEETKISYILKSYQLIEVHLKSSRVLLLKNSNYNLAPGLK